MAKKKDNAVIGTFIRDDGTIGYKRSNFIFYLTWKQTIDMLPEEQRLSCYEMISNYGIYGIEPPEDHPCLFLWPTIRYQIDTMNQKYIYGCQGGRPPITPKEDPSPGEEIPSTPSAYTQGDPGAKGSYPALGDPVLPEGYQATPEEIEKAKKRFSKLKYFTNQG